VKGAQLKVLPPRPSSVLIYDGMNRHLLAPILELWSPEVLFLRGEELNLYCLVRGFFRGGSLRDAYIDCYVQAVHPKLIITFIDNDTRFYQLSVRHPSIKTMFIQNGWRSYYSDVFETLDLLNSQDRNSALVDYMLVFGRYIGEEYSRYIKGLIIPFGSYKNNAITQRGKRQPDILAFISQYHEGGVTLDNKKISHDDFFKKPDLLILEFLQTYARENHKRLVVIPRNRRNQMPQRGREESYYCELLGSAIEFLDPDSETPSYDAVDLAGVSVAIDTTLGYESLARRNRTAIFSVRGTICGLKGYDFAWPNKSDETGFFWTNRTDSSIFAKILDRLYAATDADWQTQLAACKVNDLIVCNSNNAILERILVEELGPSV
jgi:surface carbohydrate biosynthesis protein